MNQSQIIDADFYPIVVVDTHPAVRKSHAVKSGRASAPGHSAARSHVAVRRRPALKLALLLMCVVLLAFLAARVFLWNGRRHETELLALVNPWNSIEYAGFEPKLVDIGGGKQVDSRCAEALEQMLAGCTAAGNDPVVCSAYRTRQMQEMLFQNKVDRLKASGRSQEEAESLAAQEVARPGTSEHELGLAVDLADRADPTLDRSQEQTPTQKWLMEHCWEYGFILRYPDGTSDITGIVYEPWHYRYVGVEAAQQIRRLDVTLEEYLTMFYSEEAVVTYEK